MQVNRVVSALALAGATTLSMAAAPACSTTKDWLSLGQSDFEFFSGSHSRAGSYVDCYTFSTNASFDLFGGLLSLEGGRKKLDLVSISLYRGDQLLSTDTTPRDFSFSGLTSGDFYTLALDMDVRGRSHHHGWRSQSVSYLGAVMTVPSIAAPVPEPGMVALTLLGIAGVAGALWRRRELSAG